MPTPATAVASCCLKTAIGHFNVISHPHTGKDARVGKAKDIAKGITVIGEGTRVEDGAVVADGVTLPQ